METERAIRRRIQYRYFSLSYPQRLRLALSLDLVRHEDEGISGGELFERLWQRASASDGLARLVNAVDKAYVARQCQGSEFQEQVLASIAEIRDGLTAFEKRYEERLRLLEETVSNQKGS